MQQLEIECRTTIMAAVKAGDVTTAVKMLERIEGVTPSAAESCEHLWVAKALESRAIASPGK